MNSIKTLNELKIKHTMEVLERNNFSTHFFQTKEELYIFLKSYMKKDGVIAFGGSKTLEQIGILDFLRTERYNVLDRGKEGLSREEIEKIFRDSFFADYYFSSANAITEDGIIYNVDGNGNRVAAITFGPKHVFIIVGVNKIVKNLDMAIKRNESIAAPANAIRLNKKTPCTKIGNCVECKSEDRICSSYSFIKHQKNKDRIHIIFLNENLGF